MSDLKDKDFINEQPSLHGKSYTCKWCGDIFQTSMPAYVHPVCPMKKRWLEQV